MTDNTVPKDIRDYLAALNDPSTLIDDNRISVIETELNNENLRAPEKIALLLELRALRRVDLVPLKDAFVVAVPDYVRTHGLNLNDAREDFLAVGVPEEVLDEAADRAARTRSSTAGSAGVSVEEVTDFILARGDVTTPQVVAATGASRGTVNKAIKGLVAEGRLVGNNSRPVQYRAT
jgi:hypothetical protein